ncbi:MAG TPA: hypothetical protein VFE23_05210 [Usitatibacter sp.]|nr:hypothetical protein [Usitatibacter sp.]
MTAVDRRAAAHAIELARPLIEQAMLDKQYGDSGFLHVVIVDPSRDAGDGPLDDAVLHEASFGGDRSTWDADYRAFALAKAQTSWITQADNPKGAVCVDGIVVGASGAFERFDQAYAGVVAMCLRALANHEP